MKRKRREVYGLFQFNEALQQFVSVYEGTWEQCTKYNDTIGHGRLTPVRL